ncbi:hypothetical protein J437_LFUL016405 [Ladona fulva]|uniref:ZAD domain-containing protein n=1 Tax=Ladona fulva TaxID=123851 RepID=A0A8K0PAF8_LADFU|nr:hypothetical protein J437_LFUL016405 [Ladona fulva]
MVEIRMHLENSCRLCLNKKGEFFKLFCSNQEEVSLADELTSLLNFQLIQKDHLPQSICSNCYKIQSFFKEFRQKCTEVNEYFNRQLECQENVFGDITMRPEKFIGYGENSITETDKSRNSTLTLGEGPSSIAEDPVAFLNLNYDENLDELRSNFICGQGLRDDIPGKIIMQNNEESGDISNNKPQRRHYEDRPENIPKYKDEFTSPEFILSRVKIEMCCDEDSEVQVDCPERMANSSNKNNNELNVRKDLYTGDCVRIGENSHNYGQHVYNGGTVSEPYQAVNEYSRAHSEFPRDIMEVHARRRSGIPEIDNRPKMIKHEGGGIYDTPVPESRSYDQLDPQYVPDQSYLSYGINNFQNPSMGLTTLYLQMGGNPGVHYNTPTEDWSCRLNGEKKVKYRRLTPEQRRAHALRQARNRANETPEQRERRRRANAERNALRRANMTPEQLQKSRQIHAQRERERRRRLKEARRSRTVLIDRFNKVIKKALENQEDPT